MIAIGLLITVLGFAVSFASLGLASNVGARMAMILAGIAMSLSGIIGVINQAYLKNAIWGK
jgi:hypothetical protein